MEFWSEVRRRVLTGELSKREACKVYDLHWDTLKKILSHEGAARLSEAAGAGKAGPRAVYTADPRDTGSR